MSSILSHERPDESMPEQRINAEDRTLGIDGPIRDDLPMPESQDRGADPIESEYPGAEAFVTAMHFKPWHSNLDRDVRRIVIHITAGQADYRKTARYFQDPRENGEPRYASAHYVVGQGGEVLQLVRHNDIAYHACSANASSIGIEHSARPPKAWGSDDPGLFPTEAQYRSSARLVRWLCDRYELPLDREHILGHCEADPTTSHTDCPIGVWDWDRFMQLIE